jgi:dTDP-4-dehydrorhamnose 3,5-epimerase
MKSTPTPLQGLLILEPNAAPSQDDFHTVTFNQVEFDSVVGNDELGSPYHFVQDNHSLSKRGVLRGLHYQKAPHAQGKLVSVIQGAIWDVAVDIRTQSPTYGQWFGAELSASNHKQMWIPPGFAHGFLTLSDTAQCLYKTTSFYNATSQDSILWSDPILKITWPFTNDLVLSESDLKAHLFTVNFEYICPLI